MGTHSCTQAIVAATPHCCQQLREIIVAEMRELSASARNCSRTRRRNPRFPQAKSGAARRGPVPAQFFRIAATSHLHPHQQSARPGRFIRLLWFTCIDPVFRILYDIAVALDRFPQVPLGKRCRGVLERDAEVDRQGDKSYGQNSPRKSTGSLERLSSARTPQGVSRGLHSRSGSADDTHRQFQQSVLVGV